MAVAGAITVASSLTDDRLTKYVITWTSSAGGAVTENTFSCKSGELQFVEFDPDAGGTQPTDLYDVTLLDAAGVDVLGGAGANLSNATGKQAVPVISTYFRPRVEGMLQPVVANAGNAKKGTIALWVR